MSGSSKEIRHYLHKLESHLRNESPLLVDAVNGFKELDQIAYRLGLLDKDQSFAMQIPWWPLVSVLGTNSVEKSKFLNNYIDYPLQDTENQGLDEKFTVVCYANGSESRTLPGIALDADPRFPFYRMADELEKLVPGDDSNVNVCLQIKTCPSEQLQGYTFIDSPGLDTDVPCASTLAITDHIIDISDLVLVFIDTQQPESDALQDSLEHLLSATTSNKYINKFVYILNQVDADTSAVTTLQSILTEKHLSTANILTLQEREDVDDPNNETDLLENKYQGDSAEIVERIQQIYTDRVYRILGNLDNLARDIEQHSIPKLRGLVRSWEHGVLWRDALYFTLIAASGFAFLFAGGFFEAENSCVWLANLFQIKDYNIWHSIAGGAILFAIMFVIHHSMRFFSLRAVMQDLDDDIHETNKDSLRRALIKNTRFLRSIFRPDVVGWRRSTRKRLRNVVRKADAAIQKMNDKYARTDG